MVIIRIRCFLKPDDVQKITDDIQAMAKTGVIVLPPYCELLNEVPDDEEIKVV
jgi:hypothetical protein